MASNTEATATSTAINTVEAVQRRRAAMAAIRDELAKRERTQTWLIRHLEQRAIVVSRQTMSNYLSGYRRVPRVTLGEMCAILGTTPARILAVVGGDEAVLIQTPATTAAAQHRAAGRASGKSGNNAA